MQGVRAAVALALSLPTLASSCGSDRKPVGRARAEEPGALSTAHGQLPQRRKAASPGSGRASPGRAPSSAPQVVTRSLLDEPWSFAAPSASQLSRLRNLLRAKHWRMSSFRHSRLPAERRSLEALVTFRYERVSAWRADLRRLLAPSLRAARGPVHLRLGKPSKWPWSPGVYDTRRSLLLFASMSARVRVRIPKAAALLFHLGLVPGRMGDRPLEIRLDVMVPGGETRRLLVHRMGRFRAGRWFPVRLDLSPYAGQEVILRFSTAGGFPRSQHLGAVALGRPVIEGLASGPRPNLLLVVLDTVRSDALGCYAGRVTSTPNLDSMARLGALFENAFTNAAWTRPSLMSLLTSRYPSAAGASPGRFRTSAADRWYISHGKVPTLFSHLAARGYLTRGLVNNFFMLAHERVGQDHGLSSFAHFLLGQGPRRRDNQAITAAAERFLATHRDHRFFLYLLYESAHSPYAPPRAARRRMRRLLGLAPRTGRRGAGPRRRLQMMERYRAEVMNLDDHVGRILRALEKAGLSHNTYVVITSDHGEVISRQHCFFIPRLHYRTCYSHSASLYDQVLRVPLLIRGPAVRPGQRVEQWYQHVDLVPTLLDLMGLAPMSGAVGQSLAPWLRSSGSAPVTPREVYAQGRWVTGLRTHRYKLILRAHPAQGLVKLGRRRQVPAELYDLEKDPDERWNLARQLPEVVARLRGRLRAHQRRDRVVELPGMPRHLRRKLHQRWREMSRRQSWRSSRSRPPETGGR